MEWKHCLTTCYLGNQFVHPASTSVVVRLQQNQCSALLTSPILAIDWEVLLLLLYLITPCGKV